MGFLLFILKFLNCKIKNALEPKPKDGERPCYHLDSQPPRGICLCGCVTPICAVVGAPSAFGRTKTLSARLRGHVPPAVPCPFSAAGTLCNVPVGVLFPSLPILYMKPNTKKVYNEALFLSRRTDSGLPFARLRFSLTILPLASIMESVV